MLSIRRTKHTIVFFKMWSSSLYRDTRKRHKILTPFSHWPMYQTLWHTLYKYHLYSSLSASMVCLTSDLRHPMNRTLWIFSALYVFYVTHIHIFLNIFWKHHLGLSYSSSSKQYSKSLEYRLISGLFYLFRVYYSAAEYKQTASWDIMRY